MPSWLDVPETQALRSLSPDGHLLFATRVVRMFAYGLISVILALYLVEIAATIEQAGFLFTVTLVGSAAMSLWISVLADRVARQGSETAEAREAISRASLFGVLRRIVGRRSLLGL